MARTFFAAQRHVVLPRAAHRGSRRLVLQLGACAGVLLAASGVASLTGAGQSSSLAGHPAPPLFPVAQTAPLGLELAGVRVRADRLFHAWAVSHPGRDDAAFSSFALAQLPPPPDATVQAQELTELRTLATQRTKAGMTAANWLGVYGKNAVWKRYLQDAVETVPLTDADRVQALLKTDTRLAQQLTSTSQNHFARRSPSAVEPLLRKHARIQKLSYPSGHAVDVAAELVLLDAVEPGRAFTFRAMADQVDYSRLYAAAHYRSDLIAGTLLGTLIGDYEVRGLAAVPTAG